MLTIDGAHTPSSHRPSGHLPELTASESKCENYQVLIYNMWQEFFLELQSQLELEFEGQMRSNSQFCNLETINSGSNISMDIKIPII